MRFVVQENIINSEEFGLIKDKSTLNVLAKYANTVSGFIVLKTFQFVATTNEMRFDCLEHAIMY